MIVIGITGGYDPSCGDFNHETGFKFNFGKGNSHDSAAALIKDGEVIAAIEQERINRIKHTNARPTNAIRYCLDVAGLNISDVDYFAYYVSEKRVNAALKRLLLHMPGMEVFEDGRALLGAALRRDLGDDFDPGKLVFVNHHLAHAVSSFSMSGFDSSLVMTIDGQGDALAGAVYHGIDGKLQRISSTAISDSLGFFYLDIIKLLGFDIFDEYKVMGLAPYGDPARFRDLLKTLYTLRSRGRYIIHDRKAQRLMNSVCLRRRGEKITQDHKDLAASLQEALEDIALHQIEHYRNAVYPRKITNIFSQSTVPKRLCLAGGVAHNCSLNGKILNSSMFDEVFVQPASHDAGCALGAALHVCQKYSKGNHTNQPLQHVYWGKDVGSNEKIEKILDKWVGLVEFSRMENPAKTVAKLISQGAVVGWVQGRSEFGPRALGNRSILADPRPEDNKTLINSMVKKREGFRPFAPAVLNEYAHTYFDIPQESEPPFMTFVVSVKEEYRSQLGAVTHVDGTARVQTVSKQINKRFWELIDAFRAITNVPILLNTSFNNNAEPIVDSDEDALTCFLTTDLTHLVIGDYLIVKRNNLPEECLNMNVSLPGHIDLVHTSRRLPGKKQEGSFRGIDTTQQRHMNLSPLIYNLLIQLEHDDIPLGDLMTRNGLDHAEQRCQIAEELYGLWSERMLILQPH